LNTGLGSDIIVQIEAGGFYSRKYGMYETVHITDIPRYTVHVCEHICHIFMAYVHVCRIYNIYATYMYICCVWAGNLGLSRNLGPPLL